VRTADRLRAGFGKTEVPHFALLDQLFHRGCHIFDWHVWINAVLIVQVDGLDLEPLEGALGHLSDVLRPTVEHLLLISLTQFETKFGGDYDLFAEGLERFTDNLLIDCTVNLSGVEERDAALGGRPDESDCLLLIRCRAVAMAQAHCAVANGRDFQVTISKFPLLHFKLLSFKQNVTLSPVFLSHAILLNLS
jgi:hypothetical protein